MPQLRRGGIEGLRERLDAIPPDEGPAHIDPRTGVVCVGARLPLIAFNVWLEASAKTVGEIAARVRTAGGGPPGVRALGLKINEETSQVSMNLTDYRVTSMADVVGALQRQNLTIQPGDAVIIHTGWGRVWGVDNARYSRVSPGIGVAAATATRGCCRWGISRSCGKSSPPRALRGSTVTRCFRGRIIARLRLTGRLETRAE